MAEKNQPEETSPRNLTCPLCLDIFDHATLLTCGHTFCQKCLKKYDESHKVVDHIVCPLCRHVTKLPEQRVAGLPQNVSINGLVDEHISSLGGMTAILEFNQPCTSCEDGIVADYFCIDCDRYMCMSCYTSHRNLKSLFGDHHVTSIDELMKGEIKITCQSERCSVHKKETKDLFCETCSVHTCLKCVVVYHREHKIQNDEDFEREMKTKISDIINRCEQKKADLERNVQRVETQRREVHSGMQKLEEEIKEAHERKRRLLKENEKSLLHKVRALQQKYDDVFDNLKADTIKTIKQISCSMTLIAIDRLKSLEADSLTAHTLVCCEIEGVLKQEISNEETKHDTKTAFRALFQKANDVNLSLGEIQIVAETKQSVPGDANSEGYKCESSKMAKLLLSKRHVLTLARKVDLPSHVIGMTALSPDSVAVGYGRNKNGADRVTLSGDITLQLKREVGCVYDITVLTDGRLAVAQGEDTIRVINADGSPTDIIFKCKRSGGYFCQIDSDTHDNIYSVNGCNEISVFRVGNEQPHKIIPTGNIKPRQICVAKSGALITSTCYLTPVTVTVYDVEGHVGSSIMASDMDIMCTVVDTDRVYVARVRPRSDVMNLSVYVLDGISLIEKTNFKDFNLPYRIPTCFSWCYMVCLTPSLLAFSNNKQIYFITTS